MSIEVLINFNSASFVRRGLAALKLEIPDTDSEQEDPNEIDAPIMDVPSVQRLNDVIGTEGWQQILQSGVPFRLKVARITDLLVERLHTRFAEVCTHAMLACPSHTIPKYYLVFASRHPQALRLMNDEMVKSRRTLAEMAKPDHPTLFEMRPATLVPDMSMVYDQVRKFALRRQPREDLIIDVIRSSFGAFASSEIRGVIEKLLRDEVLHSATGKWRINDKVEVWRSP